MHAFATVEQVEQALDGLAERPDPLVARLERQPGRKEGRYAQLLVDGGDLPLAAPDPPAPTLAALARDLEQLRSEVAELRALVQGTEQG